MSDKSNHDHLYSMDCADTWMNLADGTRHWFISTLHSDATLLDDLPFNKCHYYLLRLHWCVLMTTKTNSNEYLNCHNTCRRCQSVSITDHEQCLSRLINLFIIWNKIIKIKIFNVFNYFLFYFVVHMHGYVLLTTCITIHPLCDNLAACYWKL